MYEKICIVNIKSNKIEMLKDLYIHIFAFGVYNSKQVHVSGLQHYLAQI